MPATTKQSILQLILNYDLCGFKQKDIAKDIGMSVSRISVLQNSPMYKELRITESKKLTEKVIDKKSSDVARSPVAQRITELAVDAIEEKARLLTGAESEAVRNSVASDLLDRAGFKGETKRIIKTIEVSEKMAKRFERVLGGEDGHSSDVAKSKITITEEVSE